MTLKVGREDPLDLHVIYKKPMSEIIVWTDENYYRINGWGFVSTKTSPTYVLFVATFLDKYANNIESLIVDEWLPETL